MPPKGKKIKTGKHAAGLARPHVWLSGPDEYKHSMYLPWLRAKAQANYRDEDWNLTFEEFYQLWKDEWPNRGRRPDDMCMSRNDASAAWDSKNVIIITRADHFKQQNKSKIGTHYKPRKKHDKNYNLRTKTDSSKNRIQRNPS